MKHGRSFTLKMANPLDAATRERRVLAGRVSSVVGVDEQQGYRTGADGNACVGLVHHHIDMMMKSSCPPLLSSTSAASDACGNRSPPLWSGLISSLSPTGLGHSNLRSLFFAASDSRE